MPGYLEILGLRLSATTAVGQARYEVLSAVPWSPTPTTSVSYVAANRVLLIMDATRGAAVEEELGERFICYTAVTDGDDVQPLPANVWRVPGLVLEGHLGSFRGRLPGVNPAADEPDSLGMAMGIPNGLFDHVIDGGGSALLGAAVSPPGYHHVGEDQDRLQAAIDAVRDLVGEFEKPRYFQYDPDICAHGSSGIEGCNRCIEACPTDAIVSIGEKIEVNPYLCQGGGGCAASCPSGAITYRYPPVTDQLEFLRQVTRGLRERLDAADSTLLIYDSEHGADLVAAVELPEHVVPLLVEEIGSVGPELMACALAYGCGKVFLLAPDDLPPSTRRSLEHSVTFLGAAMDAAGWDKDALRILHNTEALLSSTPCERKRTTVATFAAVGGKRSLLRNALRHLLTEAGVQQPVALPAHSPMGQVVINQEACTLCMGCVSVCPGNALEAGGETPALRFIESNCLQCGICTRACPESALELSARFDPDDAATRPRTLKEEEPFRCISCGKPFATMAMIDRMMDKLSGHWMFETPEQKNRLKMCEDCRVADMFDRKDMIS